eukprot:Hpha_TRINITY_DN22971_c0_g1::TRINITY_DN22971_c0_g1_i1::g.153972::m.153972
MPWKEKRAGAEPAPARRRAAVSQAPSEGGQGTARKPIRGDAARPRVAELFSAPASHTSEAIVPKTAELQSLATRGRLHTMLRRWSRGGAPAKLSLFAMEVLHWAAREGPLDADCQRLLRVSLEGARFRGERVWQRGDFILESHVGQAISRCSGEEGERLVEEI